MTRRRAVLLAMAGAAWLVAGPDAGAQASPPRILVMPFDVRADDAAPGGALASRWLGEAAATLLSEELAARGYLPLAREDRVAVFDRLRLPMSADLSRAMLIRIGDLIGASEIVFGEIEVGARVQVRARTVQLERGRLLPDIDDRGALSDLYDLFSRVADGVARGTGRPGRRPASRPFDMPLPAFESYIKGLMALTPAAQQRFLESAMASVPRDGRVLTALWAVYTDQGVFDRALSVANAVPAESPEWRRARFQVALSLIDLKRFDGAYKELTALHQRQPSAAVSNALGIAQLRRGPVAAGTRPPAFYFERAANEAPLDLDYLFNLGYARALEGDSTGALLWMREVVRRNAADGDAHLVMGALLSAAGRGAEAQRELDLARLLGSSLEAVPATLTQVPPTLERLRTRLDDATGVTPALAQPAPRDQRDTARFHFDRGRALAGEARDREAIDELRRAIYLAPYEDAPHLLLGRLYQRGGRLGEAVDEFKVAIWCRETTEARLALGEALFLSGDRDGARREFTRALVLSPGSAEARDWLARIGG